MSFEIPAVVRTKGQKTLFQRVSASESLTVLYTMYLGFNAHPFFTDISGPHPIMDFESFRDYCCADDSQLWLCKCGRDIAGFLLLSDIQRALELANLDLWFVDEKTPFNPDVFDLLQTTLQIACTSLSISRIQIMVSANQRVKLELLELLEFTREGFLCNHFFHQGAFLDLVVLAKNDRMRCVS